MDEEQWRWFGYLYTTEEDNIYKSKLQGRYKRGRPRENVHPCFREGGKEEEDVLDQIKEESCDKALLMQI